MRRFDFEAIREWARKNPLVVIIVLVIVLFISIFAFCNPFGGDDGIAVSTPTISVTSSSSSSSTSSSTTSQAEPSLPEPVSSDINDLGRRRAATKLLSDAFADLIDSEPDKDPALTVTNLDIVQLIFVGAHADGFGVQRIFNESIYECFDKDPFVVCAPDVLDMPEGEILVVAVQHAAPIPTDSADTSWIYSLVLDSDLDPENNWVFNPPFEWDYFQGADRWYEAVYDHTSGVWAVRVTQVSEGNQLEQGLASSVRVLIDGEWIIWFIPESEIPAYPGLIRVSAFGHDGAFSPDSRGGDVSGANPTEPLIDPEFGE